ncbi:hypothetical protein M8J77_006218 [Diaphorina citri]|nr:hypothetical protein M8J77_006218 [Diaphorina citri]
MNDEAPSSIPGGSRKAIPGGSWKTISGGKCNLRFPTKKQPSIRRGPEFDSRLGRTFALLGVPSASCPPLRHGLTVGMLVSTVAGMMETDYFDGGSDQWWHYRCKKSEKSELIAKECQMIVDSHLIQCQMCSPPWILRNDIVSAHISSVFQVSSNEDHRVNSRHSPGQTEDRGSVMWVRGLNISRRLGDICGPEGLHPWVSWKFLDTELRYLVILTMYLLSNCGILFQVAYQNHRVLVGSRFP